MVLKAQAQINNSQKRKKKKKRLKRSMWMNKKLKTKKKFVENGS